MARKKKKQTRSTRKKPFRPVAKKKAPAKKKLVRKKIVTKAKVRGKKKTSPKRAPKKRAPSRGSSAESPFLLAKESRGRTAGQSGDLQGLSDLRSANSESVDELLEEGNAFEADAVKGVEDAGNQPGKEVRTHEVLEDDVPEEYLDQD